ncbi:hypothetical protein [Plastoroseomonas hellenica]|uniref:Uncharacterized protein n=1 Tax=Plastoroseomonas hellenica TaxID=2687306 RepID=A0ABS5F4F5_9PROT|nr:hypothetical protein [Plastoroseomonas hellenica]MBR0645518.1 hypothetical protein [Plastoroseomonas hellenica]MBR0667473.1 hypothetical protein [Plastoroseomonas hellenica]
MAIAGALSLLSPLLASAEGCGLGMAVTAAAVGAALHSSLPPASGTVQEALLRAAVAL